MKLSKVLIGLLLAVGLTACDKPEAKKADAAPAPAAAAPAAAAPAEAAKPAEAPALSKTESKEKDNHSAGQGVMKEVCHDKVKDGKPVMGKDGKPEQECKTIKVRQKLEATEIPPAKK
jgi:hypothetical protein